jgi:hypothetical protein
MLLNLDRVTRLGSYDKLSALDRIERGRVIEEILGRPVPVDEHAKLDERFRHVGWRLTLGGLEGGVSHDDALWTVRDGPDRVITAWGLQQDVDAVRALALPG